MCLDRVHPESLNRAIFTNQSLNVFGNKRSHETFDIDCRMGNVVDPLFSWCCLLLLSSSIRWVKTVNGWFPVPEGSYQLIICTSCPFFHYCDVIKHGLASFSSFKPYLVFLLPFYLLNVSALFPCQCPSPWLGHLLALVPLLCQLMVPALLFPFLSCYLVI